MAKVQNDPSDPKDRPFTATRWSVVVAAGHRSSPESQRALESLCQTYWYPLYAYVRRRVPDVHEAQDLTQAFFASLLEKNSLKAAEQQRGRFRSFLLTTFQHFLADEWDKSRALKRGGGRRSIPLDLEAGETRFGRVPADDQSPERLYEKQWALAFLDHVLNRLADEFAAKGKVKQFQAMKPFLVGETGSDSHEMLAQALGQSAAAAKGAIHRARRRYREILRAEIAETVAGPDEVDDEIRHLKAALG
jgi:RNA polymerase sigma-70 factor (ECF subfamily)